MIPKFGPTGRLPRGIHAASWAEVETRLGFSPKRKALMPGLLAGCRALKAVGVTTVFIDGSFATNTRLPSDFDCCYDTAGLDWDALPDVFNDLNPPRARQKATFGGEFFPADFNVAGTPPEPFLTFFQHDKSGRPKGIVALQLGTLP